MLRQINTDKYSIGKVVFLDSSPHIPQNEMRADSAISLAQAVMWNYQIREDKLYRKIISLIANSSPEDWKSNISAHLEQNIRGFDSDFFEKIQ